MAEDLPKSVSDMKAHIQEAWRTPSKINNNKKICIKHIIFKVQKIKEKGNNRSRSNQNCERNPFYYFSVCASATWPANQIHWREVQSSVGSLGSQLQARGPEGGSLGTGSMVKAVSSKQFSLSMTSVDNLYWCCAWKVPELGPPGCVLVSTVSSATRLRSQFGFLALAKAAW